MKADKKRELHRALAAKDAIIKGLRAELLEHQDKYMHMLREYELEINFYAQKIEQRDKLLDVFRHAATRWFEHEHTKGLL